MAIHPAGVSPDEQYEIGDLKGDGPRTFDVSIWNLFSSHHVHEIRAEHGQAPWGRVHWILRLLPQDAADRFARLRDKGYEVTLSVALITDQPYLHRALSRDRLLRLRNLSVSWILNQRLRGLEGARGATG